MMKRSPSKRSSQVEEDETHAYDNSDDDIHCKGLPEADISMLPPHMFEKLKKIKCTVDEEGLTAEDLESVSNGDGEVWLIQCPKYLDPSALFSGKKISLGEDDISVLNTLSDTEDFDLDRIINKKPKEKTKSTYEALALPSKGDVDSLITLLPDSEGNRRIVATSLSGSIIVRQSIEDVPLTELVPRPTGKKQLPSGLKYHHPIYGTDYEKYVIQKPDSDDEYYSKKSPKKKKNKSYDDFFSSPMKYSNKSKVDDYVCNGINSFNNDYQSEESTASHKKKKKKRKNSEIESEANVETFVVPCVKEEELETKKKKSKKRKREEEDNNNEEEYPAEPLEEISPPKMKKHKKKKSKHKTLEEVY